VIDPGQTTPWLDVHILVSATTYRPWQERCFRSVGLAKELADFPIAVHLIRACQGHLGIMRHQGYRQGHAPYVANVDDDDYLTPDAFAALKDGLLAGADAVFPQEWTQECKIEGDSVNEGPLTPGRQRHSMKVFQRRHLIDHRPWLWAGDVAQMTYLNTLPHLIDIARPTYVWRVSQQSNSMPLRLKRPLELRKARAGDVVLLNP
jgi:hypothetical protein